MEEKLLEQISQDLKIGLNQVTKIRWNYWSKEVQLFHCPLSKRKNSWIRSEELNSFRSRTICISGKLRKTQRRSPASH